MSQFAAIDRFAGNLDGLVEGVDSNPPLLSKITGKALNSSTELGC